MKTLLLFIPEFASNVLPYLSLPCLTAYMKSHGLEVEQRDLNAEFVDYFTGRDGMAEFHGRACDLFEELGGLPRLNALEQRAYVRLAWAALSARPDLERLVLDAKAVFRSDRFYQLDEYGRALRVFSLWRSALEGALVVPGEPVPADVLRPYDSSEVLISIVENPARNPYHGFFKRVLPSLLACAPDLVGISLVLSTQILPALTLGRLLKEASPDVPLVIGGNVCTRLADFLPAAPRLFKYFDVVVAKEGEAPLAALAGEIASGRRDYTRVPNAIHVRNGTVYRNPLSEPADINSLPTPDFDGFPLESYLAPARALPLYSCRGCYWARCAFCNIHMGYARFRPRDPDLVLRDMESLHHRWGAKVINFVDEAMPARNLAAVADGVAGSGLDVEWTTHARLDEQLTADLCARLRRGRCTALYFGLESGSPRILKLMDRGIELPVASAALRAAHDAGIICHLNTILGVPGETAEEAQESVQFLFDHQEVIDSAYTFPFIMARWAPIAVHPERWAVTVRPSPSCDLALFHQDYSSPGGMTPEEATALKRSLDSRLARAFPAFGLRTFGDALPFYVRHYGTTTRDELIRLSRGPGPGMAWGQEGAREGEVLGLVPGVRLMQLPQDFPRIRQAQADPLSRPEAVDSRPSYCLYDPEHDQLFKLSSVQYGILSIALGRTPAEAERSVASTLDMPVKKAGTMLRALCRLTRNMTMAPQAWLEVDM